MTLHNRSVCTIVNTIVGRLCKLPAIVWYIIDMHLICLAFVYLLANFEIQGPVKTIITQSRVLYNVHTSNGI